MKKYLVIFFWIITWNWGMSQTKETDSLKKVIAVLKEVKGFEKDTNYIKTLSELGFQLLYINPDSTIILADQTIALSKKINFLRGEVDGLKNLGAVTNVQGNYNRALSIFDEALSVSEKANYPFGSAGVYQNKGMVYFNLGKYPEALESFYCALKLREEIADSVGIASSINGIGTIYFMQGKNEEALDFYLKALSIAEKFEFKTGIEAFSANIGEVMIQLQRYEEALDYLLKSERITALTGNRETMAFIQLLLGTAYLEEGDVDQSTEAFLYCNQLAKELGSQEYLGRSLLGLARVSLAEGNIRKSESFSRELLELASQIGYHELLRDGNELLSKLSEIQGNDKLALYHFKQFKQYADRINNQDTERQAALLAADYEYAQKELLLKAEQEKKELEYQKKTTFQRWVIFSAIAALIFTMIISLISYRNRIKEKSSNHLLQLKNEEINLQKQGLEEALSNLKSTQEQLIQQEKLASLGQLTAGIAHEIQNPLNFVNNFSEVSVELVDEIRETRSERREAIDKKQEARDKRQEGELDENEKLEDEILEDIKENLKKIQHHGKRAEAIVKGMLEHSRTSTGEKVPTDINALTDEYLRLSYHGMRAKDKSFTADFLTEFDATIPKVNMVPQDIGRVLLNIINNAFQALNNGELRIKKEGFKPLVTVSTKNLGDKIQISVKDNGQGIPDSIKDKIFQPFFTTKPTGQGTGLGLSLSYDIVKAHGGEISVESKVGEGTVFTLVLPL